MPRLEDIRRHMEAYSPKLVDAAGRERASVALILRREPGGEAELLFIERARREGDPWSGHMAFPGGRVDPGDRGTRAAAERETLEEVGVSLAGSEHLGQLDDLEGRAAHPDGGMLVSAHVFYVDEPEPLLPNHEVQAAFWFPVAALLEPMRHTVYPHEIYEERSFPGILVGAPDRHIVWGLTYRFLHVFLDVIGAPLPTSLRAPSP